MLRPVARLALHRAPVGELTAPAFAQHSRQELVTTKTSVAKTDKGDVRIKQVRRFASQFLLLRVLPYMLVSAGSQMQVKTTDGQCGQYAIEQRYVVNVIDSKLILVELGVVRLQLDL